MGSTQEHKKKGMEVGAQEPDTASTLAVSPTHVARPRLRLRIPRTHIPARPRTVAMVCPRGTSLADLCFGFRYHTRGLRFRHSRQPRITTCTEGGDWRTVRRFCRLRGLRLRPYRRALDAILSSDACIIFYRPRRFSVSRPPMLSDALESLGFPCHAFEECDRFRHVLLVELSTVPRRVSGEV